MIIFNEVLVVSFLLFTPTWAFPPSGVELGGSRRRRDVTCRDNVEHPSNNICCKNCPAGKYVKSPCTRAGEMGECEECVFGTYIEHSSGLERCFKCTLCRPDQEVVRPCTSTQDTECQCKAGRFCAPDQACEVCKTCSRCKKDEVIVRNCTTTTNTECKKIQSPSASTSVIAPVIGMFLLVAFCCLIWAIVWYRKRRRPTDSQSNRPDGLKAGEHYSEERRNGQTRRLSFPNLLSPRQPVRSKSSASIEDERKELFESLSSSASNSQQSITIQHSSAFPASPPRASPMVPWKSNERDDEQFPELVPLNGEESLRRCFEYFEELDVDYHKRFFRHLGIVDNVIKSKEHLSFEDRMHEVLNIWVEKMGRDASLNDLLKALLVFNQRRTAENIKQKAIDYGHYKCENEFCEPFSGIV
ncbi:hematopoietic death receptor isoform X1 [Thunnus thynnus]|uniref:hematopoietic death receptor isoform X1 n=1 Tax=Thunnus thynnus TaxID=8237 RepID=UPI003528E9B7